MFADNFYRAACDPWLQLYFKLIASFKIFCKFVILFVSKEGFTKEIQKIKKIESLL